VTSVKNFHCYKEFVLCIFCVGCFSLTADSPFLLTIMFEEVRCGIKSFKSTTEFHLHEVVCCELCKCLDSKIWEIFHYFHPSRNIIPLKSNIWKEFVGLI